jgi:hypothetical protein
MCFTLSVGLRAMIVVLLLLVLSVLSLLVRLASGCSAPPLLSPPVTESLLLCRFRAPLQLLPALVLKLSRLVALDSDEGDLTGANFDDGGFVLSFIVEASSLPPVTTPELFSVSKKWCSRCVTIKVTCPVLTLCKLIIIC